jgi:beta-N-acetylhexosaminidase
VDELTPLALAVVQGAFTGHTVPDWVRARLDAGLGSVCVFGSNVASLEQLTSLTAGLHAQRPDVITATDEEGGDVTRLHMRRGSDQPGNAALGSADDVTLTRAVAASIGAELASAGIDLDLAPVVDVNSNPQNPVIGVRSFGADPQHVARHTEAYVEGLQAAGVGACAKHFPGHGDTAVDSHLGLPTVDSPLDVLRSRELVPFTAAVRAGTVAVMTSHVELPALDPRLPATLSAPALRLLRDDPESGGLGFDGLVISDAIDMRGAWQGRGEPAAAVLALAAGCDLLCLGPDKDAEHTDAIVRGIVDAVRDGELAAERLADAAGRVSAAAKRVAALREAADVTVQAGAASRAAERALRRSGTTPSLRGALVVRFTGSTNIAVGAVPWGEVDAGEVLNRDAIVDVGHDLDTSSALSRAEGRPVVALVRELHRHPATGQAVRALADRRPDLVVVETGWPGPQPLPGTASLLTYGASRANAAAADRALAAGWTR